MIDKVVSFFRPKYGKNIAIDLGTANTLIYTLEQGIILNQPSIVALEYQGGNLVPCGFGEDARPMIGRTPATIQAIRPLKDGVIADFKVAEAMIRHFIQTACKANFFVRPVIIICVPSTATSVEKRAIQDAAEGAGAKIAYLIEEPIAAALGAGIDIERAHGSMVIDIGGGTTEVAVLSLGGIVYGHSLRIAGDKIDESIISYIRKKYNILIGEQMATKIKHTIGTAFIDVNEDVKVMQIRGRDLVSGTPKQIEVTSADMVVALSESVQKMINVVVTALESTPPEIAADIYDSGIVLTGGGALLKGLDKIIFNATNLNVIIAQEPLNCVVNGIGVVMQNYDKYKHVLFREE